MLKQNKTNQGNFHFAINTNKYGTLLKKITKVHVVKMKTVGILKRPRKHLSTQFSSELHM